MKTSSASRLDQTRFRELVARKRAVSATLTALILAVYFGFILVLAFHRDLLALKVGEHLTMGVPVGLAVIESCRKNLRQKNAPETRSLRGQIRRRCRGHQHFKPPPSLTVS